MQPIDKPIRNQTASLLIALVFCILTVSLYEPLLFWVMLIAVCATGIRIIMYIGWYQPMPSVKTINLLALLCCVCLGWFSFQIGLLLTMMNLLVLAGALKLIVINQPRDLFQLFCTSLFTIGVGFTFHQSVAMTLFYGLMTIALLVALARYFSPSQKLLWHTKRLLVMSVQALPIAVILFIILPKLPPLWKMPVSKSTETGLSDTISPGDIANLTRSGDLAFRATFDGFMPDPAQRYWRALTLEYFDGKTWTVSPVRKRIRQRYRFMGLEFQPQVSGNQWRYEVFAEPTNKTWLYAIDVAVPGDSVSSDSIWQSPDYQLFSETPLAARRAYRVLSYPNTPMNQTPYDIDGRLNLQLPENDTLNEQTQAWAARIAADNPTQTGRIQAVLDYFVDEGFSYTLTPPAMPNAPVDEFLFDHQEGFCSHYASAMAYALRLMDIPARMVAGYHGGETLQPNVLSVYQYDAHAWVEAWIEGEGWKRFDPTAVVAPNRIEMGIQQSVEEEDFLANNQIARLQQFPLFAELRTFFSVMDYQWSRWVLGFDAQRQQNLLEMLLGQVTTERVMLLMLGLCVIVALLLALYFIPQWRRQQIPPNLRWYLQAVRKAEQICGVSRHNLGPTAFALEVSPLLTTEAARLFNQLSEQFIALRYQPEVTPHPPSAFVALCKRFIKQAKAKK